MKISRTVWSRGKSGDNIKGLPIAIYSGYGKKQKRGDTKITAN